MDLAEARLPDEETTNKHVELFKVKFMDQFRYKWRKYNKLLAKVKQMEKASATDATSRDTASDSPRDPSDVADGTPQEQGDGQNDEPSTEEPPAEPATEGEPGENEHDPNSTQAATRAEDGYIDTFLLTLRKKKVRRVVSSSHDLREDLLYEIVAEVGVELAVAYEYQLAMLSGETQVERVACYAVQCMITSLQSRDSTFDSEALMAAVLDASPGINMTLKRTKLKTRIPSEGGIISGDWVIWTVQGFFHKPGLRFLKGSADADRDDRQFQHCGCFSPWGSKCVPEVYGFRGPLYVRRSGSDGWEMVYNDAASIHKYRAQKEGVHEKHIDANREFHKSYKPCFVADHCVIEA